MELSRFKLILLVIVIKDIAPLLFIADFDLLTVGSVNDMFNEKSRDSMEWREEASQADMNKF